MYQDLPQQYTVLHLRASPNQPAISMQNNTPCHTAKCVKKFLDDEGFEIASPKCRLKEDHRGDGHAGSSPVQRSHASPGKSHTLFKTLDNLPSNGIAHFQTLV